MLVDKIDFSNRPKGLKIEKRTGKRSLQAKRPIELIRFLLIKVKNRIPAQHGQPLARDPAKAISPL
jgi:hypothetical protein